MCLGPLTFSKINITTRSLSPRPSSKPQIPSILDAWMEATKSSKATVAGSLPVLQTVPLHFRVPLPRMAADRQSSSCALPAALRGVHRGGGGPRGHGEVLVEDMAWRRCRGVLVGGGRLIRAGCVASLV